MKLPLLLAISGWCLWLGCQAPKTTSSPPNIVYILADDLGYGDVKAFNPEGKIPTPHLDQLAAEGMRFTDAHSSSSVCTPTRYGILTGRYNWRSPLKRGVLGGNSEGLIDTSRLTVGKLLQQHGYHTAFIGKWHLGWNWAQDDTGGFDYQAPISHSPNDLGFDYAYGHSGSLDMPPYLYVENERATAPVDRVTGNPDYQGFWREGPTGADFFHDSVTQHFFRQSMAYVQERAATDQPFFLYLPLPSPHTPILPAEPWQGKSGLNLYGDFVMMLDAYVGKLMATLEQAGVKENTLVVFISDNGCSPRAQFEELRAKGHDPSGGYRGHKADIFEGGHRVPFIIRWPGQVAAGSESNATLCTTDLLATCAGLLGAELPAGAGEDSYSLLPLLDADPATPFARPHTVHHSINGTFALRQGDWKLIFDGSSGGWSDPRPQAMDTLDLPPYQLYHLGEDPAESDNRYAREPEKAHEMARLMQQVLDQGRSTPGPAQKNDPPLGDGPWPGVEAVRGLGE